MSVITTSLMALGSLAGVMIVSTVVTVAALYYRHSIANGYTRIRRFWHEYRHSLPVWIIIVVKILVGILGIVLVATGFVLMPLPGPGTLITISGAALLDLEFGWAVPFCKWFMGLWPDRWTPTQFERGINKLQSISDTRSVLSSESE